MAETPDLPDAPDPDLGEPGEPGPCQPGVGRRYSEVLRRPQTKRGGSVMLAARAGREQYVDAVDGRGTSSITWRDYNYWIIELLDLPEGARLLLGHASGVSGKFDLPETYVDRLGLRHLERNPS